VSQRPPAQRSAAQSAGDAWPASTVGRGHRTVRCAPDYPVCTEQCPVRQLARRCNGHLCQKRKEIHTGPSIVTVRWCTDSPVHHPTEGNFGLPCWPPMAPSCLGAIKGTPRRMEESQKHLLSILSLPHSVSAHLIDRVSDLSSVLVVNSLCFILSSSLDLCACVCCGFVCVAPQPYSCAFIVILVVRARDSNLWRFLANGKKR
jgi:hypothetical protein